MSAIVRIPLHSRKFPGMFALVDAEDAPILLQYKWHVMRDGQNFYAVRCQQIAPRPNRRTQCWRMHLVIAGVTAGMVVDHIDRNGLNNTRKNLRICTSTQNKGNRRLMPSNTSGYYGVSLLKRTGRWKATISHDSKAVHLGYHATAEEAARAYDTAALRFRGAFATLNFPDDHAA